MQSSVAAFTSYTVAKLRLEALNELTSGTKTALVQRLHSAISAISAAVASSASTGGAASSSRKKAKTLAGSAH